jgi:hypothetical protein
MQRLVCLLVVALAQTAPLFALAGGTLDQLRAVHTRKKEIILTIEKDALYWNVDEPGTGQTFASTVFGSNGRTAVSVNDFNPFLFDMSVKTEDLEDSSAGAIDGIGGALGKFLKVEAGGEKGTPLGAENAAGNDCGPYKELHAKLTLIRTALSKVHSVEVEGNTVPITAEGIRDVASNATGKDGVKAAALAFEAMAVKLDAVAKGVRTELTGIEALIPTVTSSCPQMTAGLLALITTVTFDGKATLTRFEQSRDSLKRVVVFLRGMQWTQGGRYVVDHVQPWKVATVTATPYKLEVRSDGTVSRSADAEKKPLTATFKLVGYRRVIAEVGGGPIWVNDTVPVYGTTQKDGKTVVSVKDEKLDLKLAVATNFVLRVSPFEQIFPLLQLGASAHDNAPALLLGGGIKVTGSATKHFSITLGKIYFRPKELKGLNVGDPVGGTTDLQEKLGRVGRWSNYVGVQVVF